MRGSAIRARRDRQPIRPRARAEDRVRGLGRAARVLQAQRARAGSYAVHAAAGRNLRARPERVAGVGARHRGEVDDPRRGRVQTRDPARVGLELADLRGVHAPQAGDPVGAATALELLQAPELRGLGRHDQLAARLVRDLVRAQYSYSSRAPSTHRRAFSEPGW